MWFLRPSTSSTTVQYCTVFNDPSPGEGAEVEWVCGKRRLTRTATAKRSRYRVRFGTCCQRETTPHFQSVFPRYLHNLSSVTRWEGAVRRMLAFSLEGATAWCFAVTRMTRYSIEVPKPAKVLRAVARSYLKYTVQWYAIAKCEKAVALTRICDSICGCCHCTVVLVPYSRAPRSTVVYVRFRRLKTILIPGTSGDLGNLCKFHCQQTFQAVLNLRRRT